MLNGKLCKWGENMFIYAHLNEKNICIGFATFAKPIDSARYVQINSENQDLLYRKYENGQWSEEKYPPPETEPAETIEEKLDRLERDFQESKLVQYDALATIFEEILLLQDKLNGGGTND